MSSGVVVGLMSGTSLDGISAAVARFRDAADGRIDVDLLAYYSRPYTTTERTRLSAALGGGTPAEYREFGVGDHPIGGIMETPKEVPASVPSYWMPYFQVADVDATVGQAKSSGGTLMIGPAPIPGTGRFAILTDPQGAMFAAFQREQTK